jgi:hypothetical protein
MERDMDRELEELEQRVIERAKFWDGYIDMLIRLRDSGVQQADKMHAWKVNPVERSLREGLQQAISAAMELQRAELAECFMLAGVGGKRAAEYAKERAEAILGKDALEFASAVGWVPTYWSK